MAGLDPAIHVLSADLSEDVDARHKGLCSGRRSRTRVPGMTVEMKCVPKRNARDERGMT